MKKHIISILLAMAIIFTMTACTAKPEHERVEYLQFYLHDGSTDLRIDPDEISGNIDFSQIYAYDSSDAQKIGPDEASGYLEKMVRISAKENLSWHDIDVIGHNFAIIWKFYKENCQSEFDTQAITALSNILKQANKKNIVCDVFSRWTEVPVPEVLCKFYSSDNFANDNDYWSLPFEYLSEEEVLKIAEIFFNNPAFANNTWFASNLLNHYPDGVIADMALEHLVAVSKSTESTKIFLKIFLLITLVLAFSRAPLPF